MITLTQLIQITPLPDETRAELLEKAATFSSEQRFEIEGICWSTISQEINNKLQNEARQAMAASVNGAQFTFDINKREQELLEELVQKLELSNTDEQIDEVRDKLQELRDNSASPH